MSSARDDKKDVSESKGWDPALEGAEQKESLEETEVSAFEALEREYQEVLGELVGDKSLERFRVEYEKLYRALKKSHESEKRLFRKCRDLHSEIVANIAKVQTALRLSEEDKKTITSLKQEIEKAWKMVDTAHEKETRAKETIQQLKLEITNLTRLVEQGQGLQANNESSIAELIRDREELMKDRDAQVTALVNLRHEMNDLMEKARVLEGEKAVMEHDANALKDMLSQKKQETEREQRRRERLEKEVKDMKLQIESRNSEIRVKQQQITATQEQVGKMDQQLKDQKAQTEKALKEYDVLSIRVQKLHQELDEQIHQNTQLLAENSRRQVEVKAKEDEVNGLLKEQESHNKLRDNGLRKIRKLEEEKVESEKKCEALKMDISQLEREIEAQRKQIEQEAKSIEELKRERDALAQNLVKESGKLGKQLDLVKVNETAKRNLEHEIAGYKVEAQGMRKTIYQLEKEREKYAEAASDAIHKHMQLVEEVKMKELEIMDIQRKLAEGDGRLRQQQGLYDQARSERNAYSKQLVETQDEIQEVKRKYKIMQQQLEQYKEEMNTKDQALVKEHYDLMKLEKERDSAANELQKVIRQNREAEETLVAQENELAKLNRIIQEADGERFRQKKEYDAIINERDMLGTQLIRRNDELALLYEKIKIQQSTLQKGEIQYRERQEDIRVLRIKINELKRELQLLRSKTSNIDGLKNEIHRQERELMQERLKVKALSEELENPMNVHRWRQLEGSDPGTFELIRKIQTLQRRLIQKTEEVVEKDADIEEKQKMYAELKKILARQPGPEVVEQLRTYQQNLRERTRQMKTMAADINTYQAQVNEFQYEIERLNQEMLVVKRKYYEQKRREQMRLEQEGTYPSTPLKDPDAPRFLGGGFNFNKKHHGEIHLSQEEEKDQEEEPFELEELEEMKSEVATASTA